MRTIRPLSFLPTVLLSLVLGGCFKADDFITIPDIGFDIFGGVDPTVPFGKGVGESCANSDDCRDGLACDSAEGKCTPAGSQVVGERCVIGPECQGNSYCGIQLACIVIEKGLPVPQQGSTCSVDADCSGPFGGGAFCGLRPGQYCQKSGEGLDGATCATDGDCGKGLVCEYLGFVGTCAASGTADFGQSCTLNADCFAGLVCGDAGNCTPWLDALSAATQWPGGECDVEDATKPRAYFEVPNGPDKPLEFYRLPYPNDIRAGATTQGHSRPGKGPLPFDPVDRFLDAANGATSFGTTPTITFTFSVPLDFASVTFGQGDEPANLLYVNVDPESPRYQDPVGYQWSASDGRTKYICKNWLTVHNGAGSPLELGTTYAAILKRGLRSNDGATLAADADFQAMLSSEAPGDARLGAAWQKYAPLRQYLLDSSTPASDVIAAAVFTTHDPRPLITGARGIARGAGAPLIKDVVVCDGATVSPCADASDPGRVCGVNANFTEVQGRIELPVFQDGTRPFLTPDSGGAIATNNGAPRVIGKEDVCFSLTIPKGVKPESGFPMVLYAHGTNGSFRSHVVDGTAQLAAQLPSGGAATFGIDAVMHGPRRGGSTQSPEVLYFNVSNPSAAVGNAFQSVFDWFSVTGFVVSFSGDLGNQTGVSFDPARIAFIGHSQGATIGPIFAAFEPDLAALVLSGAGASVVNSLLTKTSPVDISAGVKAVLREEGSETQSVLSIVQGFFDPIDPANYGKLITRTPPAEVAPPHHVFMIYGSGDTYTPNRTGRILADIMELDLVEPSRDTGFGEAFEGYPSDRIVSAPLTQNEMVSGVPTTHGLCQYDPPESDGLKTDGHFVMFRNVDARAQLSGFLDSLFATGVATIPAR